MFVKYYMTFWLIKNSKDYDVFTYIQNYNDYSE